MKKLFGKSSRAIPENVAELQEQLRITREQLLVSQRDWEEGQAARAELEAEQARRKALEEHVRTLTLERDAAVASSQVTAEADQDRAATEPQGDQREHRESASQTVEAPRPAGPETFARRALLDALCQTELRGLELDALGAARAEATEGRRSLAARDAELAASAAATAAKEEQVA